VDSGRATRQPSAGVGGGGGRGHGRATVGEDEAKKEDGVVNEF
jgi:hypothetical protein